MDIENKFAYQVYITNMKWSDKEMQSFRSKYSSKYSAKRELPADMTFDIPEEKYNKIKNRADFNDEVETYVYDTLSRKFGRELNYCQIYLPLK